MTIMFIALTLTLLLVLTLLRHVLEPACPSCEAKHWTSDPTFLCCAECGWSNAATVPAQAELASAQFAGSQYASSQYEICFH